MIEVFKTDVSDRDQAQRLVTEIHVAFPACKANFDLQDDDRILRIQCDDGIIDPAAIIQLLERHCRIEVLPDELGSNTSQPVCKEFMTA